jgi:hypothetical protein
MTNIFFLRTCATCATYENSECMNGVGDGTPGGCCDDHLTHEEDRRQDEALDQLRVALDACHRAGTTHLIQGLVEVWKVQREARRLSGGVA